MRMDELDTGGPQTTGPNATVYAYYEQIKGAVDTNGNGKGWRVPCSTAMPDLVMRFDTQGGSQLVIPGSSFLQIDNGDGSEFSLFSLQNVREDWLTNTSLPIVVCGGGLTCSRPAWERLLYVSLRCVQSG